MDLFELSLPLGLHSAVARDAGFSAGYIKHQVRLAGYTASPLFTDDAIQRIFEYIKGIPRRMNQVCTSARLAGLIDQKSVLDESTLRNAIVDLDHK